MNPAALLQELGLGQSKTVESKSDKDGDQSDCVETFGHGDSAGVHCFCSGNRRVCDWVSIGPDCTGAPNAPQSFLFGPVSHVQLCYALLPCTGGCLSFHLFPNAPVRHGRMEYRDSTRREAEKRLHRFLQRISACSHLHHTSCPSCSTLVEVVAPCRHTGCMFAPRRLF